MSYSLRPLHSVTEATIAQINVWSPRRGNLCCQPELLKNNMAPISLESFYCAPVQYQEDCSNGTPFHSEGKLEPFVLQASQGLPPFSPHLSSFRLLLPFLIPSYFIGLLPVLQTRQTHLSLKTIPTSPGSSCLDSFTVSPSLHVSAQMSSSKESLL